MLPPRENGRVGALAEIRARDKSKMMKRNVKQDETVMPTPSAVHLATENVAGQAQAGDR
jgi:hypothetical protein